MTRRPSLSCHTRYRSSVILSHTYLLSALDAFGHLIVLLRDVAETHEKDAHSLIFDEEKDDDCETDEAAEQIHLRNDIRREIDRSFQSVRVCSLPLPHAEINGGVNILELL